LRYDLEMISKLSDPTLFKTDALINGVWTKTDQRFDVCDPSSNIKITDVANLGASEAQAAIAAANAAWPAWRAKTGKERHAILLKWFNLLMANQDDLARILTTEQGKPFPEAKGEIAYGASFVEWFAEEAKRVNGETLPQFDTNRRLMVVKQPIGGCASFGGRLPRGD
jgi:succinate-semialdehyde dehydrogenase / glutarate-semialdehyde dehydrogenase